MKTYLLAALISSTVLSQQVLATTGTGEGPLRPPEVATQAVPPVAPQYAPRQNAYPNPEMMKKRAEHQKEMWAHQQKMRSVQNPEERRRLSDEHMNEMRQYMQEMRDMMRSSQNNAPYQNYGTYGRGHQYNMPYNTMPRQGHYNQGQQNRPMHMNKQQHFRNVEQRLARIEQMLNTLLQQNAQK